MKVNSERKSYRKRRRLPIKQPVSASVRSPERRTIDLNIPDAAESTRDFSEVSLRHFNPQTFQTMWGDKTAVIFQELQEVLTDIYAFQDVLGMFEEQIAVSGIDPQAALLDDKLTHEVEAMAAYRILMVLGGRLFKGDDYNAVRQYLLSTEDGGRKFRSSNQSETIKAMYEVMMGKRGKSKDDQSSNGKPERDTGIAMTHRARK